jgi:hypothetical protein
MMMTTPTKIGRPIKPATEGERIMLGLRVTADLKRKLEAEALKSGRSLSQETEIRVQQSFDEEAREQKLAERDEKLVEHVEELLRKQAEEHEMWRREVEEARKSLLDVIKRSEAEDKARK